MRPELPPRNHSAPVVGGRNDPDRADRGRVLGGGVTWGRLCFHRELPGCGVEIRHVHAHARSVRSRVHGWPHAAEIIRIVESLDVGFGDTGPPYQPVCRHSQGLGIRVLDDCHPIGVWWVCKGCLLSPPLDLDAGTLPGGGQ